MMPRPSRSTFMKSFRSSAGSAKNFAPPWFSSTSSWRWIVPMVCFETLPYCVVSSFGVLGDECEHRAQVLQVEQQQSLLVGDAERDVQHAFLDIVQVHQPRQQQRTHFRDGRAHRMALLAEQIPEDHREFVRLVVEAELLGALDERFFRLADRRNAGEIALDVGGEHRNTGAREAFGQNLQRHGLAGAGRAGHETVAIAVMQRQIFRLDALADENFAVLIEIRHHRAPAQPARA